jgi:hypothetical protein
MIALALAAPWIGLGASETFFLYVHLGISRGDLARLGALAFSIGVCIAGAIVLYWPIALHDRAETTKPRLAVRAGYLVGCVIVCSVTLEIALRLYLQVPVFTFRDWRGQIIPLSQTSSYDPLLGWTQRSNLVGDGIGTLEYGIRKNSSRDEQLTSGAVLAVGDSFTEGAEVINKDTWPAQLERTLRIRVINAGVGAYGVDQAVLNAERLLPILKPHAVLLGIYEHDILRVGYRSYSAPKPYFEQENGVWVHKNNPVPRAAAVEREPWYKRILARSMIIHVLMARYYNRYWYSFMRFERAVNDPVKTTCYVLERLRNALEPQNIPALLVVQYGGGIYSRGSPRPIHVDEVLRCAHDLRFAIVDEFDRLSGVARVALSDLKQYYVDGDLDAHMSANGNALIASLIAEKLRATVDLRTLAPLADAANPGPIPNPRTSVRRTLDDQNQPK